MNLFFSFSVYLLSTVEVLQYLFVVQSSSDEKGFLLKQTY